MTSKLARHTLIWFTVLASNLVYATDYKWNQPTGGDWKTPNNWKPHGYPSSTEDRAIFETSTGVKNQITYAGSVSVGQIQFKNFSNSHWEIVGPGALYLGGGATSGIMTTYGADSIACPVVMVSDLDCVIAANHSFAFNGGLSGDNQLKETGGGVLVIGGGGNFSGPMEIVGGQILVVTPEAITLDGGSITLVNGTFWNRSADILHTSREVYVQESGVVGATPNSPFIIEKPIQGDGALTLKGYVQAPDDSTYTGETLLGRAGLGKIIATCRAFPSNIRIDLLTTLELIGGGVSLIYADIQGKGGLDISRLQGPLILTGNNSYTGGTRCGTNTLRGTTEGLQGVITSQGSVEFSQTYRGTFAGTIEGDAKVVLLKTNAAHITFTGYNTYSRGTYIQGGTLQLGTAQIVGDVEIDKGATLAFCQAHDDSFLGNIRGAGRVCLLAENKGCITLENEHMYVGGTEILGGSLALGENGALAPTGAVFNEATFDISRAKNCQIIGDLSGTGTVILGDNSLIIQGDANAAIFSGDIVGQGKIIKKGKGAAIFYGATHHTGGVELQEGTLQISEDGQLGPLTAPLTLSGGALKITSDVVMARPCFFAKNGLLTIDQNITCQIETPIEGLGGFTKDGQGCLLLSAENTYTGMTTLAQGSLILQAKTCAIQGPLHVEGGHLLLKEGGQISPQAAVNISGGVVDLAGHDTIWNSLTFTGGQLEQSDGVISLEGQDLVLTVGNVKIPGTVDLLREGVKVQAIGHAEIANLYMPRGETGLQVDDELCLAKSIKAGGVLSKTGAGILSLEGNHVWTGVRIEEGHLSLAGKLISDIVVAQGSFLHGNGAIFGDLTLEGVLQPGASIGTLHLTGHQRFNSGSAVEIEFDSYHADQVHIDGSLHIGPDTTLVLQRLPGAFLKNITYNIIETNSGQITGAFTHILDNLPPAFQFDILYSPNSLALSLFTVPFATLVAEGNAGKVATALDTIELIPGSDLQAVYWELLNMPTVALLSDALRQIDPSILKGLALVQESNAIRINSAVETRMQSIYTKICHDKKLGRGKWGLWGDLLGNYYYQGQIYQEVPFHAGTGGALVAFDYLDPLQYFVGAGLGYSYSSMTWNKALGHGDINSGYGMIYGGWYTDLFYVDAVLQGGYNQYHEQRHIKFGYLDRRTHGNFSGAELLAQAGFGMLLQAKTIEFSPFITSEFIFLHQEAFDETGTESLDLAIDASNYTMLRNEIGLNLSRCFALKYYSIRVQGKLSYIREDRFHGQDYTAEFIGTGVPFTVKGMNPNRNLFSPGFALGFVTPSKRSELSLTYSAEVNGNYWDQNINIQFGHRF